MEQNSQIFGSGRVMELLYGNENIQKPPSTYPSSDSGLGYICAVVALVGVLIFLICMIPIMMCVDDCKAYRNRYKGYEELA